ncbi:MAG: DUF424 family protein [Desulfurococcales archaeon]|nr:DUF424 family protein [Desulfurococcales archaeon]
MLMLAAYDSPYGRMVLITDEELVGKSYYDQERRLALMIPENIHGGDLVGEEEAVEAMKSASIIVVTGERSVNLAVREGYLHPASILRVGGVPHAHIYKIPSQGRL